ncbi:MAG: hypothetical protein QP763_08525 [Peptoniphilus duerdenii]|uniref:hypothetical protein n=1 Tax=Peptoniphilus duerdenii TaxID=507750 RepID=UPI00254C1054|nr:hypothetical protein [Peptoniphilus duerdenii]MDK8277079.1 hypothetical protein [Peptoniphilus duerdenii]
MALVIVSAKNINEANEKSINKKDKKSYIIEDKGLQDFFFEYKDSFSYYDIYYKLEPYGTSKIDNSDIVYIKEFAESVMNFIETNTELENESIEKFNVSLSKVKRYIKKLIKLTQYAIIYSDNLIGLGD